VKEINETTTKVDQTNANKPSESKECYILRTLQNSYPSYTTQEKLLPLNFHRTISSKSHDLNKMSSFLKKKKKGEQVFPRGNWMGIITKNY
jgi:hypothetical protein